MAANSVKVRYRGLQNWKYQVMARFKATTEIKGVSYQGKFMSMTPNGAIRIEEGYCWDGPSGPTWDSKDSMRGSLVHDALYQLMRLGVMSRKHRKRADEVFRSMLLEDGMPRWRVWYFYRAVRAFGGRHTKPVPAKPTKEAP